MNKIAVTYLAEKLTRMEVKDAAIKALRDKEEFIFKWRGEELNLLKLLLI